MATKDFAVFDGDSHVVEPTALWDIYLEPEYRTLGKHALWRQEGRTGAYLKINGEVFRDRGNPNLPRHALWRPGMTWDAIGELDPRTRHPMTEGASDPSFWISRSSASKPSMTLPCSHVSSGSVQRVARNPSFRAVFIRPVFVEDRPQDFAAKVVWGSRYPHHDTTSAWDAVARLRSANVPAPLIARMMGQNAAAQFGIEPVYATAAGGAS